MAAKLGLRARARFHAFSVVGSDPVTMLDGVIPATEKVLAKAGLSIDDLDAYEVNEAFAPVPLLWSRHFNADPDRLNPRGGAIALGHPLGASGTRLLTTLIHHLEATQGRFRVADHVRRRRNGERHRHRTNLRAEPHGDLWSFRHRHRWCIWPGACDCHPSGGGRCAGRVTRSAVVNGRTGCRRTGSWGCVRPWRCDV